MKSFVTIIKSDYLQRTRSYAFLITLCASLAIAYTFVPEPNAKYSTIRVEDYVGYYNSAWFGYVTAIMTSVFLSLIGFYLINSGIKKDFETKVGQIVASTPISNFNYLFSKTLSNFMLLLTIVGLVFIMSIILFILYNDNYSFELLQFIKPYVFITIPTMFFISVLAVVFEVFFGKYSVIQNIGFFFLFSILSVFTPKTQAEHSLDLFGSKIVIEKFEESVSKITNSDNISDLSIGYVVPNDIQKTKRFEFNGMDFPTSFIISRLGWIAFGILIIFFISRFFHRFDVKERISNKKKTTINIHSTIVKDINVSSLPKPKTNYSVFPLFKTEFLLLFRKGKKWLWIVNLLGMLLLVFLPLNISHQMLLPVLWFLQVSRLSDLTSKELTNNVHYFAFTTYKPISRLLLSQLMAGIILMVVLALPLIIRYGLLINSTEIISILLGSVFIVLLAAFLGIISKGKKLFEVLFFMITYTNINGIPFTDYFGGFEHDTFYLIRLTICIAILIIISLLMRKQQLKN